jgi:ABC-type nickel/cobalt efflux system permease component RcnA
MDSHSIITFLSLAFALGILHALDADHVMVISNFIGQRHSLHQSLKYCARWALGHGTALFVVGFFVFILGRTIPVELSVYAEYGVGAVLILLGIWVLWDLRRKNAHLHFHQHDGLPHHAHWHRHHNNHSSHHSNNHNSKQPHSAGTHKHFHSATMIGVLHGMAGSAPLLALIPLTQIASSWLGIAYLGIFAIGVLLSMLLFGGLLSGAVCWLQGFGNNVITLFRITVASGSVAFGVYMLLGSRS